MMSQGRIRIKFCGMTNPEDALEASRLGVDAIGLIFYSKSPRYVSMPQALDIIKSLPPFITKVGVFVNESKEMISHILEHVPLDILQFHGNEPPEFCRSFEKFYIKTISVGAEQVTTELVKSYYDAAGLLFDTFRNDLPGGSGATFDWNKLPNDLKKPLILAGGLNCENISEALQEVKPFAVDVTSGIERKKGVKDWSKMKFFVERVMDYSKTP